MLGQGTSTSGWIYSSNLYMSLMCYLLYDAVITRARSSRTEGSQRLVVVLLVVFSFLLCLVSRCVYFLVVFTDRAGRECSPPSFITRSASIPSGLAER